MINWETIYHYFRHFGTLLHNESKGEKNMFSRVLSAAIWGIQGPLIFVEADALVEGLWDFPWRW